WRWRHRCHAPDALRVDDRFRARAHAPHSHRAQSTGEQHGLALLALVLPLYGLAARAYIIFPGSAHLRRAANVGAVLLELACVFVACVVFHCSSPFVHSRMPPRSSCRARSVAALVAAINASCWSRRSINFLVHSAESISGSAFASCCRTCASCSSAYSCAISGYAAA